MVQLFCAWLFKKIPATQCGAFNEGKLSVVFLRLHPVYKAVQDDLGNSIMFNYPHLSWIVT